MSRPRSSGTATVLTDGRVLVVGGLSQGPSATDTAEIYDPGTDTWTPTAPLHETRSRHTATLLADGRVLVVGGRSSENVSLASAEIFDPAANSWAVTGALTTARDWHTATVLSSGKVMVAGGLEVAAMGSPTVLNSVEVFDPAAGTWAGLAGMPNPRWGHSATRLADGRVLVAGGAARGGECVVRPTAEVFDPATGRWAPTRNMEVARGFHAAAVLPDGRVLVAGGNTLPGDCTKVTATAELYDPAANTWRATGNMAVGRAGFAIPGEAVRLGTGRLLVTGGRPQPGGAATASSEEYNPATGTWANAGDMTAPRSGYVMGRLQDGRVLVAGGVPGSGQRHMTAEIYGP